MNIWVKGKEKLFRWDTAQQLILDAKDAKYVDFGTESTPIRVQVTNGACPIPDEWLQTAGFKNLWVCRADDTRECAMLSVEDRPVPPDYVSTPTQKVTFESLVRSVNEEIESLESRVQAGEFNGAKGEKGDKGDTPEILQSTGENEEAVMSQKAVTEKLSEKLEKVTSTVSVMRLYGVPANTKETTMLQVQASLPVAGTIPRRGQNGTFAVGSPSVATDAANKAYVDSAVDSAAGVVADKLDVLWKLNEGISYDFVTDSTEAASKTVPSGGKFAAVERVGGKTVVWNQLVNKTKLAATQTIAGITFTNHGDGTYTANGTATANSYLAMSTYPTANNGHVLFLYGCPTGGGVTSFYLQLLNQSGFNDFGNGVIKQTDSALGSAYGVIFKKDVVLDNVVFQPRILDLTLLFGAGNEPTTVDDARVAWVKQYAEAHPGYNDGSFVSASVGSVKHGETVVGTIPAAVRSLPGYGWSVGDVCNGVERTETGWQYVQRVDTVDLGTLNWNDFTLVNGNKMRYAGVVNKKNGNFNLLTTAYALSGTVSMLDAGDNVIIGNADSSQIRVVDNSFADAATFKAAMSGIPMYYELSEPVVTDVTAQMADFPDNFAVAAGDTIAFETDNHVAAASTVKYLRALGEVEA